MQVRDRYPRTLQQAFGPYTSNAIHDKDTEPDDGDYGLIWWFAMLAIASASIGLIFWA